MKFHLVKDSTMANKKINRGILIGTSIVLAGSIIITSLFFMNGKGGKIVVSSDNTSSQEQSSTNDSSINNSSVDSSSENSNSTSTSQPNNSSNNSTTPSSKPKSSSNPTTSSSKPASSSSAKSSQPIVVDGYFNPRNASEVSTIVNEISNQVLVSGFDDFNADKELLKRLVLVSNQVKADGFDCNTDMEGPFLEAFGVNAAAVVDRIWGRNPKLSKRIPIDIYKIFANKKDQELIKNLCQEKIAIDNAAYEGKNAEQLKPLIETAFNRMNSFAFSNGKIATNQGQVGYNDLGPAAKFCTMRYILLIVESYATSLNNTINTNYDLETVLNKVYPEIRILKDKLNRDNDNVYMIKNNKEKVLIYTYAKDI